MNAKIVLVTGASRGIGREIAAVDIRTKSRKYKQAGCRSHYPFSQRMRREKW